MKCLKVHNYEIQCNRNLPSQRRTNCGVYLAAGRTTSGFSEFKHVKYKSTNRDE